MIRILLVDDHPSVMEGTKLMLEKEGDMQVEISGSGDETLSKVANEVFDVLLFDLNMPRCNGIELTKMVLKHDPEAVVVIFTGFDISPYFMQLIDIGVSGFVQKTATREHLVNVIRCAIQGDAIVSLPLLRELRNLNKSESLTNKQLSSKDLDILKDVAKGKNNREIAALMHMSQRSLEYALTQLFQKLQVRSRVEAVAKSKELGLLIDEI